MTVALLVVAAVTLLFCSTTHSGGFEPYYPPNEALRLTILGVWQDQAVRPSPALEQRVREALLSIREVEGRADPRLAELLSTRLKAAWTELERSRAVWGLGYTEFDEVALQAAEARFQETLNKFTGARALYPEERYQAALQTLAEAQALSRNARRAVPGLSADDVLLTREKRQQLLLKEPEAEGTRAPTFRIEDARRPR